MTPADQHALATARVLLLKEGRAVATGPPEQVLQAEIIEAVYEISITVILPPTVYEGFSLNITPYTSKRPCETANDCQGPLTCTLTCTLSTLTEE